MQQYIPISARLSAVSSLVSRGPVADIGCDHGKLAIHLAQRGFEVYAVDCSAPSLQKCHALAQAWLGPQMVDYTAQKPSKRLQALLPQETQPSTARLHLLLGDGLSPLPKGVGCIVLAGLGALTSLQILVAGGPAFQQAEVIFAPASRPEALRKALRTHGYGLTDERLVYENNRYYPILRAVYGQPWPWPAEHDLLGPLLLQERNPLLPGLAARKAAALRSAIPQMHPQQQANAYPGLMLCQQVARGEFPTQP